MKSVFKKGRLELAFEKFGTGNHTFIFLHGYGKTKGDFNDLASKLPAKYCGITIDLPFHGESENQELQDALALSKEEWSHWVSALVKAHGGSEGHSMVAFSIGARLALCHAESEPEGLQHLILLAPDGFIVNPWNMFFTRNRIGRRLFKNAMRMSNSTDILVRKLAQVKLIDVRKQKIIEDNIRGSEAKMKLYHTWVVFKSLWPDQNWLKKENGLSWGNTLIMLGKHDSVIPSRQIQEWVPEPWKGRVIREFNFGHDLMVSRVFQEVEREIALLITSQE
jgi:pimeloyl-ACP methyl ester carboxylesterase